jgi:hypothetical protein
VVGLALVGDGVVRARAPLAELVCGLALALAAVPLLDGLTVAALAAVAAAYGVRPRWSVVEVTGGGAATTIAARGRATCQGFTLAHVGRLDLAGRDLELASSLAGYVDALAVAGEDRHLSLHVRTQREGVTTALFVDATASAPSGWVRDPVALSRVTGLAPSSLVLERWGYLRAPDGVCAVLRVRDFTAAPRGVAVLSRVQLVSDQVTIAVHADVLSSGRARHLAERAVHRVRSDGATTAAAGFRRTAHVDQHLARLAERESLVAAGRALLRVGVFVTVSAQSLTELTDELGRVRRALHEAGMRVERGRGRQLGWYCAQLPGGPGW